MPERICLGTQNRLGSSLNSLKRSLLSEMVGSVDFGYYFLKVARRCKNMLLQMATPDAIARLPASGLKGEAREMWQSYFREQQHSSLAAFMRHVLTPEEKREKGLFIQVRIMQ